jgi:IstB-like ATP binding protein
VFGDQAMILAAIDRLVHHATILEMNVNSYRRKAAVEKARGAGHPPSRATIEGFIQIVVPIQIVALQQSPGDGQAERGSRHSPRSRIPCAERRYSDAVTGARADG